MQTYNGSCIQIMNNSSNDNCDSRKNYTCFAGKCICSSTSFYNVSSTFCRMVIFNYFKFKMILFITFLNKNQILLKRIKKIVLETMWMCATQIWDCTVILQAIFHMEIVHYIQFMIRVIVLLVMFLIILAVVCLSIYNHHFFKIGF